MTEQSLKDKTVKGLVWSSVERFSVQGVQFLVMLVIARILEPKDFGLVGMLAIFLAIAQTLIDSGFSQALIRRQNRSEEDNSTVFLFNLVISFLSYCLLYAGAPLISEFYNEILLTKILRILGVVIIINGLSIVQRSIFAVNIDFKTQAKASFIGAFTSGIVGVWMAYNGYGVWTLVWQQILNAVINTVVLWMSSSWHPHWRFSWKSFRELFSYGSKMMGVALIDTLYTNMFGLVIGKVFNAVSLGFYAQADRFTKLPSANVTAIIQRVTYPVMCSIQNDDMRLCNDYRRLIRMSAFIVFPLMCLLAGVAYPLVELLIGEKWKFAAALIIPLCFGMMWYPVHAINLNLLQVKGRSDLFLKLEIIKKVIAVVVLIITIPYGVQVMCYSTIMTSIFSLVLNTHYTGKLIHVGLKMQFQDIFVTLLISLLSFVVSYFVTSLFDSLVIQLLGGIVAGGVFFISSVYLLKMDEVFIIKQIVKR